MFKKRIISLAMALLILVVTTLSATAISVAETNYLSVEISQNGVMTIKGNLYGEWLGAEVALVILKPDAENMTAQEALKDLNHKELVEDIIQTTTDSYGKFTYTHTLKNVNAFGNYTVSMSYRNTDTLEADRTVVCNYDPVVGLFANAHIDTNGYVTVWGYTPRLGVSTVDITVKRVDILDDNTTTERIVFTEENFPVKNEKFVLNRVLNNTALTGVHIIYVNADGGKPVIIKANYFGSETTHKKTHPDTHPLQLFVSPDANSFGAGSEASPFNSLHQAIELLEDLKACNNENNNTLNEDINIFLRGGNHYLTSALELNTSNTMSNGRKLTITSYPGERATIHGGKTITGWKQGDNGIYYADVELDDFRELYVNGKLATRAKSESTYQGIAWYNTSGRYYNDYMHYINYTGNRTEIAPGALHRFNMPNDNGATGSARGFRGGLALDVTDDSGDLVDIATWGNQEDIEIVANRIYKHLRIMVTDVITKKDPVVTNDDGTTGTISGKVPILLFNAEASYSATDGMPYYPWLYETDFYMENAYELLDQAGEWYYDNDARRLYYKPEAGVYMETADIVAPQVEELITITGTSSSDKVSNVIFKDLDISYATWRGVNDLGAYASTQAGNTLTEGIDGHTPGAIVLNYTDNIDFIGCTIKNLGAAGIELEQGAVYTDITDNEIYNIGASAVSVGKTSNGSIIENLCTDTNILRNHIHDVAFQYTSNTGIWALYTQRLNVSHNEIHRMPYTGVSVGWGWNRSPESEICKENTISYNYIYDVMLSQGVDGSPIYTLGNQPGTKIHHNYLYINNALGHGIYLDEGSNNITVTENVINITDKALNDLGYEGTTDWFRITYLGADYKQNSVVKNNYTTTYRKDVVDGVDQNLVNLEGWKDYLLNNNTFRDDYEGDILNIPAVQEIKEQAGIHGVYVSEAAIMNNPHTNSSKFLTTEGSADTVAYFRIKNYDATDITTDRRFVIYEGKRMKYNEVSTETIKGNSDEWYTIPVDTSFYNSNTITGAPRYKLFFWEVYNEVNEYLPLLKSVELYN